MLICFGASGEAVCPPILSANSVTLGIYRGRVRERLDAKIHIGSSPYVNPDIFCDYARNVFISHVENGRVIYGKQDSLVVLLMDNWSGI
jgi:hypothetical protein